MLPKKKPKKKLTPLQEIRLLRMSLIFLLLIVLWLLLSPSNGLYGLYSLRRETAQQQRQTEELVRHNETLRAEIERLRNDPEYLERVAREKYQMLKKNEQVFDFSHSEPAPEETEKQAQ